MGYAPITAPPLPRYQGYVDERSVRHVRGWLRDLDHPERRVRYRVVLDDQVLAADVADRFSPTLEILGVGDAAYAFTHRFAPPLDEAQRDRVRVVAEGATAPVELAPALASAPPADHPPPVIGYVDERSTTHVAGWMMDADAPDRRLSFRITRPGPDGEVVVALGRADAHSHVLQQLGVGDARYAFHVLLPPGLDEAARDSLAVRPNAIEAVLPLAPALKTTFEPIGHVAMDITDNCNLRCPFCVFDHAPVRRTSLMSAETFTAAARLLPYVSDGNFWLSCVHEATLHPDLLRFIDSVPPHLRRKLMFTTNLAKRMPDSTFAHLATTGVHHINISVESLDPPLYERMRKGARFPIFADNWRRLLDAFAAAPAPPALHYISMAYRSNLAELPGLVTTLRDGSRGARIEIRDTMAMPHIDPAFLAAELPDAADWRWLQDQLAAYPPDEVVVRAPPPETEAAPSPEEAEAVAGLVPSPPPGPADEPRTIPRPLQVAISWTGALTVYDERIGPDRRPVFTNHLATNINDVPTVEALFEAVGRTDA